MERSRKLALTEWTQANNALHQYFTGNKSQLADHLGMSRTTVTAFFKQQPVREAEFRKLCLALRLNWQEVSKVQAIPAESFANAPQQKNDLDTFVGQVQNLACLIRLNFTLRLCIKGIDDAIDALIEPVREHCRQKILTQHSRMRLLSGEEIGVDQLYVDVWVLNRSPRTFMVSQSKLLETFDLRNDRLGLGDRIKRNPGFDVANANPNLLILGKPGAGKTTFLKHLAMDWCKGQYQPNLISVFIELRRIRNGEWKLLDAIGKELGLDEGHQIRALNQQIEQLQQSLSKTAEEKQQKDKEIKAFQEQLEALSLQILLKKGKFLVLMDGLDEVPTNELRRKVQEQLQEIAEQYVKNRWILTCRTQITESIPDGFTSVEVADFSPKQVQQFVQNWFQANGYSDVEALQQWERFSRDANKNPAVKELTVTPVLLSLMCLVLHDEGEMPSQMTELYKRGIRLLLEKWNDAKAIEGWEVGDETYQELKPEQKEALLIEIAARKFENPENFVLFRQHEIAAQIAEFLHLTNRKGGVAVLKSMEAQHGLLIERADEIWSFSHLTFQEYFTAKWINQLQVKGIADKISESHWQKVVELAVKAQQPADRLLRLIKQSIDQSISNEPTLNQFLTWVFQKAAASKANYKPAALRAFYIVLALALALGRTRSLAFVGTNTSANDSSLDLALTLPQDLGFTLTRGNTNACSHSLDFALDLTLACALDRAHDHAFALDRAYKLELAHNHILKLTLDLDGARVYAFNHTHTLKLAIKLKQLRTALPSLEGVGHFQQWWQGESQLWIEQLRQTMIEHRNIGHDWQFNDQQKYQLQRYYDANRFLVKLMQIDGAVSQEVRAEIEDTLLLPWEELQRRQPDVYGQPQSTSPSPIRVFIAYSHEDEDLREQLDRHLANLKRQGKIQAWHRGAIEAGAEWDAAIKQQLETAQITLLLISADFVASDHCYDLLQQSLQRHSVGKARVIPIILRPTDLKNSPFSHLSPLPTDGVPITRWSNRDEAFLNVVEGIRVAIESITK
jgi:predicted NACHT family NTPase